MNIGSSATACSGVALSSNTAWAAAQQRSKVSVSSIAAALMEEGISLCIWILSSNGFFAFMSDLVSCVVGCVGASIVEQSKAGTFSCNTPTAMPPVVVSPASIPKVLPGLAVAGGLLGCVLWVFLCMAGSVGCHGLGRKPEIFQIQGGCQ